MRGTHHDDEQHAGLMAAARDAWARTGLGMRWDYWMAVEWSHGAGVVTAQEHLEGLVAGLRRESPGVRLLGGVHRDPMPHAHLVVKLSRRLRARFRNATEVRDWLRLRWRHGPVWCAAFDHARLEREHHTGGGALRYLARDAGSVVFG